MQRVVLHCYRYRLVLHGGAHALVQHSAQLLAAAQRMHVHQPQLTLSHTFAGVEQAGCNIGCPRRRIKLGAAEPQRIVGTGVDMVNDKHELAVIL